MTIIEKVRNSLIILVILVPISLHAQIDADSLFEAGDWSEAADAYQAQTAANPENAVAWFRLAASARQAGRHELARDALVQAEDLDFSPVRIAFERARLEVLANDTDGALEQLRQVAASGFTGVNFISNDPVLAKLSGNADFDALVDDMSVRAFPCEHDKAFSDFDFWVGKWDVHLPDGTYAGSNVIERAQRGCVLIENWRGAGGVTGTSINYLDRMSDEWVQVWNAASGSQIHIRGGMTDDGMRLVGTLHDVASGTTAPFRGLWTPMPDGRVRQYFEQWSSDGETWTAWFEGIYTRKAED